MNMMHWVALATSILLPLSCHGYEEDLQPPDVSFYAEAMGVRSNFDEYSGKKENGFRIRAGIHFNDMPLGRWSWRAEGGISQFGEGRAATTSRQVGGLPAPIVAQTIRIEESTRIDGFELGGRLYDNELFYLRFGGMIYNQKFKREELVTQELSLGSDLSFSQNPEKENNTGMAPYVGAGIEFPIIDKSIHFILEYDYYRIEGAGLDNLSAGLQFIF